LLYGTSEHSEQIDVKVLEKMLEMTPKEWLSGKDPEVDGYEASQDNNNWFLASYIMHFGVCAHPNKDKLKKTLQILSFKRFKALGEGCKDPDRDHKSGLCMTTTSDLGYTFWHSLYSNEGWEEKVKDPNLKYNCNTKWTSDREEIPMEDRADTDPGMEAYKKCLEWARELKQMNETKEYCKLQVKCNDKAVQLGSSRSGVR
jgi:hypothetical protein